MTVIELIHEVIHPLAYAGFLYIGYDLGKKTRPTPLLDLFKVIGSKKRDGHAHYAGGAIKDPFEDEREVKNGEVQVDPADLIVEDEVEEVERAREEPTPDLVAQLRKHVGHEVSVVKTSLGTKGVMICNTCKENVPLANRKDIVVAESATAGPDFTAPSNENIEAGLGSGS